VTKVSVLSLLDIGCNSQQVNNLADQFLDYDEKAGDVDTRSEDISLTDIVDYFSIDRHHISYSDTDVDILMITPPTSISGGIANTYLTEIANLLEHFPVDILQTAGQALPIPTAVQHLRKILQGFHNYEESKKKQGTLANWLQIGSTKTKEMKSIIVAHPSQIPEPAHPAPIPAFSLPNFFSTPTPSPPSYLLCFSPMVQDWIHNSYEALNESPLGS